MAEKKQKYCVLKLDDLCALGGLEPVVANEMEHVVERYIAYRISCKKENPDPSYIVCNQDEPYAGQVWEAILNGEDAKNGKPLLCEACKSRGFTGPSSCCPPQPKRRMKYSDEYVEALEKMVEGMANVLESFVNHEHMGVSIEESKGMAMGALDSYYSTMRDFATD